MKYLQLKRIATLLSFIILMSSFIAYRTGAFEKLYNKNSSAIDSNQKADVASKKASVVDTPPIATANPPAIFSSSKSTGIVQTAPMLKGPVQTTKPRLTVIDTNKKTNEKATHQYTQQELTIMASSKSIGIVPASPTIMSSSKSAPVFLVSPSQKKLDSDTTIKK
jgi:hypothetical protein